MAPLSGLVAGLSLASLALFAPALTVGQSTTLSSKACGQIMSSIAAGNVTEDHYPTVPAQLAYDCLNSVPFNQSAALRLVDGLVPYLKWQSNLAWIKDPPDDYIAKMQPAYDVLGELMKMRENILKTPQRNFLNEYAFVFQLYLIFQNARDSNLQYIPDAVGTIFEFGRQVSLVSVSKDGRTVPEPYVYSDIVAAANGANFTPSAITHIDNQFVNYFLMKQTKFANYQDQDAAWNALFYQPAVASTGVAKGRGAFVDTKYVYPGPSTHLVFANGSEATYENYARVLVPFGNITDGSSLYHWWFDCTNRGRPLDQPTIWGPFDAPGYPEPVLRQKDNAVGGYYLEGYHNTTAVLSLPTFGNKYTQPEVQATITKFLAQAKADGKQNLIIDFSGNNDASGDILLAYDLYEQLFPKQNDQPLLERYRAFESTRVLAEATAHAAKKFPRVLNSDNGTIQTLNTYIFSSSLDYHTDLDAHGQPFPTWQSKYGPATTQKGDSFSALFRKNLNDPLLTRPFTNPNVTVHGYGALSNSTSTKPLFNTFGMVVLTDGTCGGACAAATHLLRSRQGIRTISVGGRAASGPMQAIGSTRGTFAYSMPFIQQVVQYMVSGNDPAKLNATELNQYWNNAPLDRMALGTNATVNFKDAVAEGDGGQTPLQFLYEKADCRMLYTRDMVTRVEEVWQAAADAAFGRPGNYPHRCFEGLAGLFHFVNGTGLGK